MRIKIAEKLRPYSHQPGTYCLLPRSSKRLQLFPTLIRIDELDPCLPKNTQVIPVNLKGPVEEFTILQDLEKERVIVSGRSPQGFFRYILYCNVDKKVCIQIQKASDSLFEVDELTQIVFEAQGSSKNYSKNERLSLGNHKAQDWDLVCRRANLVEILPAWYLLGQLSPLKEEEIGKEGTAELLKIRQQAIENNAPEFLVKHFTNLFKAGFQGVLSPRLVDDQFQGIVSSDCSSLGTSPLVLLKQGAQLIRSLFFQKEKSLIRLLPALPPEFHCGRLLNIEIEEGEISFEWTKKCIRQLSFRPKIDCQLQFSFKHIRSFRLRKNKKDRGERVLNDFNQNFEKNIDYFFDNFE